jgi:hypothetical protein
MELHSTRLQLTGRRLPPVETLSTPDIPFSFSAARDELTFVVNEAFISNPMSLIGFPQSRFVNRILDQTGFRLSILSLMISPVIWP